MTEHKPVIAIVGPGAVGGLLAWLLHRSGANVAVVGRTASVEAIKSHGIRVTSTMFGEGTEFVHACETVPEGASVLLTVKTFGLDDSVKLIAASKPHDVLSLMNGVGHTETLSQRLDGIPVSAGSIAVEASRSADGSIEHRARSPVSQLPPVPTNSHRCSPWLKLKLSSPSEEPTRKCSGASSASLRPWPC